MQITCSTLARQHLESLLRSDRPGYDEIASLLQDLELYDSIVLPNRQYINTQHFRLYVQLESSSQGEPRLNVEVIIRLRSLAIEKVVATERKTMITELKRAQHRSARVLYSWRFGAAVRKEGGAAILVRVREFSYCEHAVLSGILLASKK